MKPAIFISILALVEVGQAVPLVPNSFEDGLSLQGRDPRGGRGGGGLFGGLGGLFGGLFGGGKGGGSPPKAPPQAPPRTSNKAGPTRATSTQATPSKTSSSVVSSSIASSVSQSSITSATSSQSSQVTGISSKSSITSGASSLSSSSRSSSTTSSSTTTNALGRIAWPRPTMKGAHPPTFQRAKVAKVPSFPKTAPKTKGNSSLYTPEFNTEAGVPLDLQKRSQPHANNNPKNAVPAGVECPDSTDEIRNAGYMKAIPQGEAMFYSSVDASNIRGQDPPSKQFAAQHNLNLLRDYVAQKALDNNLHKQDRARVPNCPTWWTLASKYLAEEVSGNVAVLLPPLNPNNHDTASWALDGVPPTAMWFHTEWEAVRDNPKVCSVWRFDLQGNAHQIHERAGGCPDARRPF